MVKSNSGHDIESQKAENDRSKTFTDMTFCDLYMPSSKGTTKTQVLTEVTNEEPSEKTSGKVIISEVNRRLRDTSELIPTYSDISKTGSKGSSRGIATITVGVNKSNDKTSPKTSDIFSKSDLTRSNVIQVLVWTDEIDNSSTLKCLEGTSSYVFSGDHSDGTQSNNNDSTICFTKSSTTENENFENLKRYEIQNENSQEVTEAISNRVESVTVPFTKKGFFEKNLQSSTSTQSSDKRLMDALVEPIKQHELRMNYQLLGTDLSQAFDPTNEIDHAYQSGHKLLSENQIVSHNQILCKSAEWEVRFETILKEVMSKNGKL